MASVNINNVFRQRHLVKNKTPLNKHLSTNTSQTKTKQRHQQRHLVKNKTHRNKHLSTKTLTNTSQQTPLNKHLSTNTSQQTPRTQRHRQRHRQRHLVKNKTHLDKDTLSKTKHISTNTSQQTTYPKTITLYQILPDSPEPESKCFSY
jgi:hypothetical protein